MNTIAWIIYFANVADALKVVLAALFAVSLVVVIVHSIVFFVDSYDRDDKKYDEHKLRTFMTLIAVSISLGVSAVIVPTERTIYMMVASEYGADLVPTDKIQGVVNPATELLRKWIEAETIKLQREIDKK